MCSLAGATCPKLQFSVASGTFGSSKINRKFWSTYCRILAFLSDQEENTKVRSIRELGGELADSLEHSDQLTEKAVQSHQKLGLLMTGAELS